MTYEILRLVHLLGLALLTGGLIGVFVADLRSRRLSNLHAFAEAVRTIAVFYDGVVVPGALMLLVSGAWLIAAYHGGLAFLETPWLAGMVFLFLFEFVEGNTVTRLYFMRLNRLARAAAESGQVTPELANVRRKELVPTFTHFLDLPVLMVIVSLGVFRPETWTQAAVGIAIALTVAACLTAVLPRLYPWRLENGSR